MKFCHSISTRVSFIIINSYHCRIEVLSGMAGPTLMTEGVNQFVDGINRSILSGLFGMKEATPKSKKHYPTAKLEQFSHKEDKRYPAIDMSRYNY